MAGRVEVEIGEYTFNIRKFAPIAALRLVGDLQKRIVGPAAMLIATQRREIPAADAEFAEGLKKLSEALDGETLAWAFKQLVNPEYVSVNMPGGDTEKLTENTVGILDIGLDVLMQLCIEVAKVNYADFMKAASGLIGLGQSRKVSNLPAN